MMSFLHFLNSVNSLSVYWNDVFPLRIEISFIKNGCLVLLKSNPNFSTFSIKSSTNSVVHIVASISIVSL